MVPVFLPCAHGSTAVSNLKAPLKPRESSDVALIKVTSGRGAGAQSLWQRQRRAPDEQHCTCNAERKSRAARYHQPAAPQSKLGPTYGIDDGAFCDRERQVLEVPSQPKRLLFF